MKQAERDANYLYKKILKDVVYPLLGKQITYMSDIDSIGHRFLKHKFKGVYPSDKIPKLSDLTPYAILNLDKSEEPGSHWIAIAKIPGKTKKIALYDSFGRHHSKIIKNIELSGNGKIINSDPDAEQSFEENDCGSRSIGWLLLFENFGVKKALYI